MSLHQRRPLTLQYRTGLREAMNLPVGAHTALTRTDLPRVSMRIGVAAV